MKHALLAVVAIAALAFPGLAATATNKTHAASTAHAVAAKAAKPVHQMLGAVPPFIRTGSKPGQGLILRHNKTPRPQSGLLPHGGAAGPTSADNLTYGQIDQIPPKALASLPTTMTYNTNYAIFWVPDGYRTASNYQDVISQYFSDVAHDSYGSSNVDSTGVQYMDALNGPTYYDSTYGGAALDTQPYPKSACQKSVDTINAYADSHAATDSSHIHVLGTTECLSDTQIQAEVKRFADSMGWSHGPNTEFFVYTAHNVDSCFYADGKSPGGNLNNVCAYDYYCAYHSEFGSSTSTEYIYANMPWPNQAYTYPAQGTSLEWKKSDCDGGEHPNGTGSETLGTDPNGPTDADAADEVINVTSHEHMESTTDPTGYGWWDDNGSSAYAGYENGDMCAWYWASDGSDFIDTSSNNSLFTSLINGHPYFLQGEWSNADANTNGFSGCQWGYTIESPSYTADTNTLTIEGTDGTSAAIGSKLDLTAGAFSGHPVFNYWWMRCSPDTFMFLKSHGGLEGMSPKRFALGTGCNPIRSVYGNNPNTPDTYTTTAQDVGYVIVGGVWADSGSGEFSSGDLAGGGMNPTAISVGGESEYTNAPSISASSDLLTAGVKLTLDEGTWSPKPTSFTIQWQRCAPGSPESCTTFKTVKGAPNATGGGTTMYTLVAADAHSAIRAIVTATNKYGADNFDGVTDLTGEVVGYPTNAGGEAGPNWANSPVVGTADTLNLGTWTATPAITGYSVTIQRCPLVLGLPDMPNCEQAATLTATSRATSVSYTPVAADDGDALVASVYAKNSKGVSDAAMAVSDAVGGEPVNTAAPSFDVATGVTGDQPTLNMGSWTPNAAQYRITYFICSDPSDVTTCQKWYVNRINAAADPNDTTDQTQALLDLGGAYYLRGFVQAINAAGYSSDGSWSDAVQVNFT